MTRSRIRKQTASVVAVLALAGGLTVGLGGTASAATPECHGVSTLHSQGNGYNEYEVLPTTTPGSGNWQCKLGPGDGYVGDQYDSVWYLQRSLNACYGQGIAVDGKYGSGTQEAVRNVQRFHNANGANPPLVVDGIYGPNTAFYMEFVNTAGRCWTKT